MSESQFDDLLGDFGGSSTTTTTTTTKTSSNGAFDDNFDPFGPSSDATPASNGGGDNSELLLDFSTSAEVKNGESNNGVELQFETSASDSANPLYDMSADTQSSNPLYDMSSGSGNPLYDLSTEGDTNQSSNPLYEFSAETTTSDSTNPLYEFEDIGTTNDTAQDADLISGTNDDDDGSFQTSEPQTNYGDLLGDIGDGDGNQNTNESGPGEEIHFEVTEPVVMNGNPKDWFGEVPREEEPVQQEEDEDVEEEQLQDYSERVEVVEEAEAGQEVQEEEEQPPPQPVIPTVEITQTPSVSEAPEGEEENLPDLVVREEGDVYDDENAAAGGGEEFESGPMEASGSQGDSLTAEASFGHDRREEDLEQYCMDREESDLVDASEEQEHGRDAQPMASLKAREERSRSPSRSIGPDTPEESHVDVTPEDTDATEEMDTLRPRGDRSHAPSRSLEPEDRKPKDDKPAEITTYRSSSTIVLSPTSGSASATRWGESEDSDVQTSSHSNEEVHVLSTRGEEEIIEDGRTVSKTTRTENRYSGSGFEEPQVSSNQWEEERNRQNADYDRQAGKEEISHFSEMSSVKDKFESGPTAAPRKQQFDYQQEVQSSEGGVYESEPQAFQQWQNEEEEEEGVYENQPQKRDDVVREADTDRGADLPAVGTAQNIRAKFLSGAQQEAPRSKREITPPAHGAGGEYVSEPRGYVEKYEGKAEAGVFESQPATHNPDVVTSTTEVEEARYQSGFAKSTAARFREMGSNQSYTPSGKREITPDRTGRVEYVSEPRGQGVERYEGKAESGVFESEPVLNPDVVRSGQETEEQLPEQGMARNIASKFRQISSEGQTYTPRGKREITPDRTGRVEYVSEPRGQTETYEVRVDAGVYENQPVRNADVITSDSVVSKDISSSQSQNDFVTHPPWG